MPRYVAIRTFGGLVWQETSQIGGDDENVLEFYFNSFKRASEKGVLRDFAQLVREQNLKWITLIDGTWIFDAGEFKKDKEGFDAPEWLHGKTLIEPDLIPFTDKVFGRFEEKYRVHVLVSRASVNNMRRRIFLSHKTANKPEVQKVHRALKAVGLDPWLDTEDMTAGVNPDRGIAKGFSESCAVVFFISPEFKDEKYLAGEIDYAMAEKRKHDDKFAIITLVMKGPDGARGSVPDLLRNYVYKEVDSLIDAFSEIVRALPLRLGVLPRDI